MGQDPDHADDDGHPGPQALLQVKHLPVRKRGSANLKTSGTGSPHKGAPRFGPGGGQPARLKS